MSETQTETDEQDQWPNRSRFRKKYQPYGVRICNENLDLIQDFDDCKVGYDHLREGKYYVTIETREGKLEAGWGDWIMEDSEGHHYPIADQEIRVTYEPVDANC